MCGSRPRTRTALPHRWKDLSPSQQRALEPLAGEWNKLEGLRKQKWLEIANRYNAMKPDERVQNGKLFRDREMKNREEPLRVGPDAGGFAETGGCGQAREAVERVFVGKLGDDFFVVAKTKLPAADVPGPERIAQFPDAPAIAERFPGFRSETWMGLVAPPNTPSAVASRISGALAHVMQDAEVRRRLVDLQADPAGSSPDQMAQRIKQETERWTEVIRSARITVD